jgi:type IV pilus assembly protein PilZ
MIRKRRPSRAPIEVPLFFFLKGNDIEHQGIARSISLGGMLIETIGRVPFQAEISTHLSLPGWDEILVLPGIVRWIRDGHVGVQFGSLGPLETHIITDLGRASLPPSAPRDVAESSISRVRRAA